MVTLGIVLWQIEVASNIQLRKINEVKLAYSQITDAIEENATCYNLYREFYMEEGSSLYLVSVDQSGKADSIRDFLGVLGENTRAFENPGIDFKGPTKVDLDLRIEFLSGNSENPSNFQQWVDSSVLNYIIDSTSRISLGDSQRLITLIEEPLVSHGIYGWAIYNSTGRELIRRGDITNQKDTLELFKQRATTFGNPFELIISVKQPNVVSLLIDRWETWAALLFVVLIGLVLYLNQNRILQREVHMDEQRRYLNYISHEFNTQITKINMAVEGLTLSEVEDQDTYIPIINKGSKQLANHVKQLLSVAKSSTYDGVKMSISKFSINNLIQQIVVDTAPERMEFNAECDIELFLNENLVKMALTNLIENAVKYGGQEIKIDLSLLKNSVQVSIWDNGKGVDSQQIKLLTKPWFRANRKTVEGFGLGLNHVQQIAKKLKGSLTLENTKTPDGFLATIQLPIAKR